VKARIVEREKTAVARQRSHKYISASTHKHATIEELLDAVFSLRSVTRLYNENEREKRVSRDSAHVAGGQT
jgi:ribosome-interacting GTPase 1